MINYSCFFEVLPSSSLMPDKIVVYCFSDEYIIMRSLGFYLRKQFILFKHFIKTMEISLISPQVFMNTVYQNNRTLSLN